MHMISHEKVHTIIAFRHGRFPLNVRAGLRGEAALRAVEEGIPADADETMDLLPEGRKQAERLQPALGEFAIDACLRSRTRRTLTTAELGLAKHALPGGISVEDQLRERSRGIFSYAPNEWANNHPLYRVGKDSILDWQPYGIDFNGNAGESVRHVRDTRIRPVLMAADEAAPSGIIACATHAEWMLALRAFMLGLDDVSFHRPLVPDPPAHIKALQRLSWISNGQMDIYDTPDPSYLNEWQMSRFRSIGTDPVFDTGWIDLTSLK